MSNFTRTFITVETAEETFLRARVQFADQLQYEKTARARGWTPERDQAVSNMFMAFQSTKRTGQHTKTWEEWQDYAIDCQVSSEDVDTETGQIVATGEPAGDVDGDPTL